MNNTINIALADDHKLFLDGMGALLSQLEGVEIGIKAANGEKLLEALGNANRLPDVLLLDVDMPVLDGIETFKLVRRDFPTIKVMMLSMHNEEPFILHLIELGVNGYLLKNSTIQEVEVAIHEVVNNDCYFDSFVMKVMRNGLSSKRRPHLDLSNQTRFTQRELEVLDCICDGLTASESGEKLFISKRTVDGHRQNLLEKTGTRNIAALVIFCIREKIIELD